MKDTIAKGSGNSRTLASVPNFLTLYPTYEAFAQALIDRTLPIDLGPLNPSGLAQKGDDLNKANLLTDPTAELLGLDSTAVPNDALMALYAFAKGMAQIKATVHDASGNPFANIPVTGLTDVMGNTPVFTNAAGVAVGYSMSGSKTFSTANILDLTSVSKTVSVAAGNLYEVELVPARRNFALFQSSVAKLYITDAVDNVDVSVVSGGGNGEAGTFINSAIYTSGKGGNTGTSSTEYGIDMSEKLNTFVSLIVGGSNGGTSNFLDVEAKVSSSGGGNSVTVNRGSGRIRGGNGSPVNYNYLSSFTDSALCGGNGGGGSVGDASQLTDEISGGNGSSPFGGDGGWNLKGSGASATSAGFPGTGYGGAGGGGGATDSNVSRSGGAGYHGVVSVRIHFKEGITV